LIMKLKQNGPAPRPVESVGNISQEASSELNVHLGSNAAPHGNSCGWPSMYLIIVALPSERLLKSRFIDYN